jgi:glycosyltransferase involved in cell wall biosynthesis
MDAVVMPSRWEAFGLVAIEAMRAGVAVIGSNRGALPEVIRNGIGGRIFDLDDPDALGRLLEELDADELRRLGESGRHRWERKYVADRMYQLTCEAYESVLAAPVLAQSMSLPEATHRTAPQPM